ncbi:hypothetical protein EDD85DRAFT_960988 [Armillaria nabsnona]|nr:hypothetical protein EDD85DRAFT_960988 [Armillaria nabsnona]
MSVTSLNPCCWVIDPDVDGLVLALSIGPNVTLATLSLTTNIELCDDGYFTSPPFRCVAFQAKTCDKDSWIIMQKMVENLLGRNDGCLYTGYGRTLFFEHRTYSHFVIASMLALTSSVTPSGQSKVATVSTTRRIPTMRCVVGDRVDDEDFGLARCINLGKDMAIRHSQRDTTRKHYDLTVVYVESARVPTLWSCGMEGSAEGDRGGSILNIVASGRAVG